MEMYGVPIEEMRTWIESAGGRLVQTIPWDAMYQEEFTDWQRWCFVAAKQQEPSS